MLKLSRAGKEELLSQYDTEMKKFRKNEISNKVCIAVDIAAIAISTAASAYIMQKDIDNEVKAVGVMLNVATAGLAVLGIRDSKVNLEAIEFYKQNMASNVLDECLR